MARRTNHYDAAFEELLRRSQVPYIRVDETRRALLAQASLKSMDFLVTGPEDGNLLVDVKGRRFGPGGRGPRWENWATEEDIACLLQWEQVFGAGFRAALVFAYDIVDPRDRSAHASLFAFRNRTYAFYGVWVDEYGEQMRSRSRSWETVWLPAEAYRRLRTPIQQFLDPSRRRRCPVAHSA